MVLIRYQGIFGTFQDVGLYLNLPKPTFCRVPIKFHIRVYIKNLQKRYLGSLEYHYPQVFCPARVGLFKAYCS